MASSRLWKEPTCFCRHMSVLVEPCKLMLTCSIEAMLSCKAHATACNSVKAQQPGVSSMPTWLAYLYTFCIDRRMPGARRPAERTQQMRVTAARHQLESTQQTKCMWNLLLDAMHRPRFDGYEARTLPRTAFALSCRGRLCSAQGVNYLPPDCLRAPIGTGVPSCRSQAEWYPSDVPSHYQHHPTSRIVSMGSKPCRNASC